jgi:hypothetical protein
VAIRDDCRFVGFKQDANVFSAPHGNEDIDTCYQKEQKQKTDEYDISIL